MVATDAASPRQLLLLLVRLCCLLSVARCAEYFHCTVCSVFLFFLFFPTSPPMPLRQNSGSLRPRHCLEPVRLLFWLLRFVDVLATSACVVRCPHGSTMRFSTMSCVYSTRLSRTLNSFPSLLQRISLALLPLLLFHALPGP